MTGKLVRAYAFEYDFNRATKASLLRSFQAFPADAKVGPGGDVTATQTPPQPPTTLRTPSMADDAPGWQRTTIAMGDKLSLGATPPGNAVHPPVFGGRSVPLPGGKIDTKGDDRFLEPLPYGSAHGDFDGSGRTSWVAWGLDDRCDTIDFTTLLARDPGNPIESNEVLVPYDSLPSQCEAATFNVGDFDGDLRDDLVIRMPTQRLAVALSRGDGTFAIRYLPEATPAPFLSLLQCVTGDLDDDEADDLACAYDRAGEARVGIVRLKGDELVTTETTLSGLGIASARRIELSPPAPGHSRQATSTATRAPTCCSSATPSSACRGRPSTSRLRARSSPCPPARSPRAT
jgi:hypothetical protein